MKKKYFLVFSIVSLLFLSVIAILTMYKYKYRNQEQMEMKQQTSEARKEMEQKKEELIQLCAEYEEEIEMISEEILGMLEVNGVPKDGLSWEDVKNAINQLDNTEWEMLSGELQPYYPLDEPEPEGKVYFYYWSEGPFSLEILYINVDEEKKEEYLITRKYHTGIEFIKINEHLYIYLEEWQMI